MAYVPVPKDLNAVKTKVLLNLTKRQLVCFSAGAAPNEQTIHINCLPARVEKSRKSRSP